MPTFEFPLRLPRKLAPSFEFVTDFSNAPFWDPRSLRAEKLTPGPVRLGTKFVMEGGPFTRAVAERLPPLLRLSSSLPYEVTKFEPQREAVLEGETMLVRYHDRLVFSEDGELISQFGEKRRIPLKIDEIPPLLIKAVLATEDARFYEPRICTGSYKRR